MEVGLAVLLLVWGAEQLWLLRWPVAIRDEKHGHANTREPEPPHEEGGVQDQPKRHEAFTPPQYHLSMHFLLPVARSLSLDACTCIACMYPLLILRLFALILCLLKDIHQKMPFGLGGHSGGLARRSSQ